MAEETAEQAAPNYLSNAHIAPNSILDFEKVSNFEKFSTSQYNAFKEATDFNYNDAVANLLTMEGQSVMRQHKINDFNKLKDNYMAGVQLLMMLKGLQSNLPDNLKPSMDAILIKARKAVARLQQTFRSTRTRCDVGDRDATRVNNMDYDDYSRNAARALAGIKNRNDRGRGRGRGNYNNFGNRPASTYNSGANAASTSIVVPGRNAQPQLPAQPVAPPAGVIVPGRNAVARGGGQGANGNRVIGPCYNCGYNGHLANNCPY